jgi:hypothetical protein
MKKTSKIALAATASVVIGALGFALPSLAHDSSQGTKSVASAECSHDPLEQGSGEKMGNSKESGKGHEVGKGHEAGEVHGPKREREQHREGHEKAHNEAAEVAPSK